jgi:autotransporter-associated beta strand protein
MFRAQRHGFGVRTDTILSFLTAFIGSGVVGVVLPCLRPAPAIAATPEIRGTWITTTGNDDWTTDNIGSTMTSLKSVGLNTVYVQAWKNGYTNFTSPTLAAFTGTSSTNSGVTSPTLVADARQAAASAGLVMGAWFEYGLMSQFLGNTGTSTSSFNPLSRTLRDATWTVGTTSGTGWLLRDQSGNYTTSSNGFVWMNPLAPEVRNLIKGIAIDAVTQFDLQIIQFDDHLSWPVAFGWDSYTAAVYKQETGRNLPSSTTDSRFLAWRQGKTQAFFAELSDAIKAVKPSVVVSLSPSVISSSSNNWCFDWTQSMAKTDEVLPQTYTNVYSGFESSVSAQLTAAGANTDEMGFGLKLAPGSIPATPWDVLERQLDYTRSRETLGHSIWYSDGISGSGTAPVWSVSQNLAAYYDVATNGIAPNPHFQSVRWAGATGNGGSGTWSLLGSQWKDRSTIWVSSAEGIFDGAGGTVTISGSVMAERGLDFRTSGYTLSGGTLDLRGVARADNRLTIAAGVTTTVSSQLTGSTGLLKTGSGTLAIAGTATGLTGGIQIDAGTLQVGSGGTAGRLAASTSITVAAGGTLAFNRSDTYGGSVANAIGGSGEVRVLSGGLTLSASNGYSGATRIQGGTLTLAATGAIGSSALVEVAAGATFNVSAVSGGFAVSPGQTLAGSGSVVGAVAVGTAATLSPGASPGTLTVTQNVTLSGGGNYNWQVYDASGTAGSTTGWDLLSVGGGLDIAATSGSRFNINLWSLSGVGPDVNGSALNFNSAQNGSWKIASAAGGITGFSSDAFTVNTAATSGTAGFANDLAGGSFAVVQQGNDLVLQFTAAGGPTPAPVKITGVYVKGSGWNASYLARSPFSNVQGETVGWELPDGPAQLANASNVAWNNVNTITVEFDQPIAQPDAAALQLVRGTASGNQTIVPTLDPTLLGDGSVAQWTLPAGFSALERGKYVLSIAADGITNTAGTTILDGDWITGVSTFAQGSGDGEAGGTFNFFFNSLVGDVNGDGVMNVSDLSAVRNALTSPLNTPLAADSSNYRLDINGSNSLSSADISQTRAQLTSALGTQLASLPAVTAPTAGGTIAPVPEPGVIGLLSVGLAGLIALRIARRR